MRATASAKRIRDVALIGFLWLNIVLFIAVPSVQGYQNEARSEAELFFRAPTGSVSVGDEILLYIEGSGLKNLYAYELKLEYAADRVRIESAASGVGGRGYPVLRERRQGELGMLTFAYTRLGSDAGIDGTATLLALKLSMLSPGQAEVRLVSAKRIDSELQAGYWNEGLAHSISIGQPVPPGDTGDGGADSGSTSSAAGPDAWAAAGFRYQLVQAVDGRWSIELLKRETGHHRFTLTEELIAEIRQLELDSEPLAHSAPIRLDWRRLDAEADEYALGLPLALLQQTSEQPLIELVLPAAVITLPGNMLGGAAGSDPSAMAEIGLRVQGGSLQLNVRVAEADWPDSRMFHHAPLVSLSYKPTGAEWPYEHQLLAHYWRGAGDDRSVPVANSIYDANRQELPFKPLLPGIYTAGIASASFADLGGAEWARRSIELLAARGIVQGYGEARFQPGAAVTRAEFVHMLAQAMEWHLPGIAGESDMSEMVERFTDVSTDAYYWPSLGIARMKEVIFGTSGRQFQPDTALKREDMFVVAARALHLEPDADEVADALGQFPDSGQLSRYAANPAAALAANELIRGSLAGLEPLKAATRAEAAVFLARLLEFMHRN